MERIKRSERIGAMARILMGTPNRIHTLGEFCELFGAAKSTVSEDMDLLKQSMKQFGQGEVITVAGAAGGVRYRAILPEDSVKTFLAGLSKRLCDPSRLLPGGFIYTSDVTSEPETVEKLGQIFAARYYDMHPHLVLTMETKGIPMALMTARMLDVPLVIARKDSHAFDGSAVKINYIAGSDRIETMALSRRAVQPGQRAVIIDDFMKGGGTLQGMAEMMREFQAEVVGVSVMIATKEPQVKRIKNAHTLLTLEETNADQNIIKIQPAEEYRKKSKKA